VVILHGVNMVYKRPPYYPAAGGFSDDDATFLERNGFNTVRLGVIYKAVEPSPGTYDDGYLAQIAATEENLAAHGIFSLLDFHQDLYNERFQGEGWPDWAVQDDGLPNMPQFGFPGNYLGMPALNRAFDHFWANDPGPGGVGLQDRYAAAYRHVAQQFAGAGHALGYDLMNEPWPGSVYPSCTNPAGCPVFDSTTLTDFTKRVIAQIRAVDPQKLTWYEPLLTFDFGAQTSLGPTGDANAGMSFHDYCLPGAFGGPTGASCSTLEDLPFQNAEGRSQATGDALLLTEFGATDDLDTIQRIIDDADRHMVGWQYWHYCGCDDPTTQGATSQAVVDDANQPPTGSNVRLAKLAVLSRPYPQVVAGTPQHYGFDPPSSRFELAYSTTGPAGRSFVPVAIGPGPLVPADSPQSEIYVPASHYPGGYEPEVDGAGIASAPNAQLLKLVACPGRAQVSLNLRPAGVGSTNGPDCVVAGAPRPRLRVKVKPKHTRVGKRTCFRVTVRTEQGTLLVGGEVRLKGAGKRARRLSNGNGRATICHRYHRPGVHRIKVTKLGFETGIARIRVRRA
jgi:endoglycosylceramidase